ncbi:hypothetical protein MMC30_000688 [Trapelia coarctata]|nr:hypothetical protein [Trapelia coarctata]
MLDAEVRDDRDDDGVRIRGDDVDWLRVGDEIVGKEMVERGRLEVGRGDELELERYAAKSNAGGRKKPDVTGLQAVGVHEAVWVEVGEAGSEPEDEVSSSARRQVCEQYASPAVCLSQPRQ